jgi:phosphoribosylglycinamide formyltransferase-1
MSTFVSESITPVYEEGIGHTIVPGEPVLPSRFLWHQQEIQVALVLCTWKEDGPCRHGSGEQYLRKHWYRIQTGDGREMEIYFERQARSPRQTKKRWWLYSVTEPEIKEDS